MPSPAPPHTIERVETQEALQEELDLRIEVFVREQGFSLELEVDAYDVLPGPTAHFVLHLLPERAVVGTVRVRPYGAQDMATYKLERIVVRADCRKYGFGSVLVKHVEQWVMKDAAGRAPTRMIISSQEQATPFYQRLGYVAEGEKYPDEGVPHQKMGKQLVLDAA